METSKIHKFIRINKNNYGGYTGSLFPINAPPETFFMYIKLQSKYDIGWLFKIHNVTVFHLIKNITFEVGSIRTMLLFGWYLWYYNLSHNILDITSKYINDQYETVIKIDLKMYTETLPSYYPGYLNGLHTFGVTTTCRLNPLEKVFQKIRPYDIRDRKLLNKPNTCPDQLPPEIWDLIVKHLDWESYKRLSCCNRFFYTILTDNSLIDLFTKEYVNESINDVINSDIWFEMQAGRFYPKPKYIEKILIDNNISPTIHNVFKYQDYIAHEHATSLLNGECPNESIDTCGYLEWKESDEYNDKLYDELKTNYWEKCAYKLIMVTSCDILSHPWSVDGLINKFTEEVILFVVCSTCLGICHCPSKIQSIQVMYDSNCIKTIMGSDICHQQYRNVYTIKRDIVDWIDLQPFHKYFPNLDNKIATDSLFNDKKLNIFYYCNWKIQCNESNDEIQIIQFNNNIMGTKYGEAATAFIL